MVRCAEAWRKYPVKGLREWNQTQVLKRAEKKAAALSEFLDLADAYGLIWGDSESYTGTERCLRKAEKLAATPSDILDCAAVADVVLSGKQRERESKRLYKKAVKYVACADDWKHVAGTFRENGDCGLVDGAACRETLGLKQISVAARTDAPQPTLLAMARAKEAEPSTLARIEAMMLYARADHANQDRHCNRVLGKAECDGKTALDLSVCAVARFECGWETFRSRTHKAKRALGKAVALASCHEDWANMLSAVTIIWRGIERQEAGGLA